MQPGDLDEVVRIERASFGNPWTRAAFVRELSDNRVACLWVARPRDREAVLGYLCVWVVLDELHVTNFAVDPSHRRRGVGRELLGTMLAFYQAQGIARVTLEVRPSNVEARRLYEAFGFRQVGRRRRYYPDTGEDALLMEARWPAPPSPPRNHSSPLEVH